MINDDNSNVRDGLNKQVVGLKLQMQQQLSYVIFATGSREFIPQPHRTSCFLYTARHSLARTEQKRIYLIPVASLCRAGMP